MSNPNHLTVLIHPFITGKLFINYLIIQKIILPRRAQCPRNANVGGHSIRPHETFVVSLEHLTFPDYYYTSSMYSRRPTAPLLPSRHCLTQRRTLFTRGHPSTLSAVLLTSFVQRRRSHSIQLLVYNTHFIPQHVLL